MLQYLCYIIVAWFPSANALVNIWCLCLKLWLGDFTPIKNSEDYLLLVLQDRPLIQANLQVVWVAL